MKSDDRGCFRNSVEELPKVKVRLENLPRKEGARKENVGCEWGSGGHKGPCEAKSM